MHQSFPPMTLGNMRANGVRTLGVWCSGRGCGRHRIIEVERYGDDVPVPWFGPRMRCERYGHLGGGARPNWGELAARGTRGLQCGVWLG
jgi:hypothetical protein